MAVVGFIHLAELVALPEMAVVVLALEAAQATTVRLIPAVAVVVG